MSSRFDRDASLIVDMTRESVAPEIDGALLLSVSGMLEVAYLRGLAEGYGRGQADTLKALDIILPAKQPA